jgi:hypothetical protein
VASTIFAATIGSIAIGYAIGLVRGGGTVREQPLILVFWAVVATSWWVIPGTMVVIRQLNRLRGRKAPGR